MKNILITGAYGFVGTNLSGYLARQEDVELSALDVKERENQAYASFYSWEELDKIKWDDVDTVIHLAGKAHDTKNKAEAQVYFDINTGLTRKVFDRFMASGARKFIFFSSVKAAADKVAGDILTEDIVPEPKGPYGESKIKAEEYINEKLKKEGEEGKRVYIVRPCMIHGPGNKGNLNLLYKVVSRGIPWPLGDFDNRRSFTSIDNLCFIIQNLINKEVESGIYHIGDDEPLSTNRLIFLIGETVGKRVRIWRINRSFIRFMAKVGDWLHLPLNSGRLQKLTENYVVSNEKIKKAISVEHLPVSAEEGMWKTLESFSKRTK